MIISLVPGTLTMHLPMNWNKLIANAVGVSVCGVHQTDGAVFNREITFCREIPIDEKTAIYWYTPTVKPI